MGKYIELVRQRPFYFGISLLMVAIAIAGFGPVSYTELINNQLPQYAVVHLHALIFVGWLLFFATQAFLASSKQMRFHARFGRFLSIYAIVVVLSGLAVAFNRYIYMARRGEVSGAWFLTYFATFDMLAFGVFFLISLFLVRWPEAHKRMMVVTCTILLYPAVTRLEKVVPIISHPQVHGLKIPFMIIWMLPVIVGLMHDLIYRRRLHPANVFGIASLFLLSERGILLNTDVVAKIGDFFQRVLI